MDVAGCYTSFENVRDERYLRVFKPLTWRDATKGEIMTSLFNTQAILNEHPWLRIFWKENNFRNRALSIQRLDKTHLERTSEITHSHMSGGCCTSESHYSPIFVFDSRGVLVYKVGYKEHVEYKKGWWSGGTKNITTTEDARETLLESLLAFERREICILNQSAGEPHFVLIHTSEIMDFNSTRDDYNSLQLCRAPKGYSLMEWVDKVMADESLLLKEAEAVIDHVGK